jgi:hypothetical protein
MVLPGVKPAVYRSLLCLLLEPHNEPVSFLLLVCQYLPLSSTLTQLIKRTLHTLLNMTHDPRMHQHIIQTRSLLRIQVQQLQQ